MRGYPDSAPKEPVATVEYSTGEDRLAVMEKALKDSGRSVVITKVDGLCVVVAAGAMRGPLERLITAAHDAAVALQG